MTAVAPVEPTSVPLTRPKNVSSEGIDRQRRVERRRPKVAVVSTYPPTKCGLATFAADVEAALAGAGAEVRIVAVEPEATAGDARPHVLATIEKQDRASYRRAARTVNEWNPDAVLVQHEFGIYGGCDGEYLLDFVEQVTVPIVATLHTVLSHPSEGQQRVLSALASRVAAITVFTATAASTVRRQFGQPAPVGRRTASGDDDVIIEVIEHGAPVEVCVAPRQQARTAAIDALLGESAALVDAGRFVVGTFGLLSPGKGLEQAVDALALVAVTHPQVSLLIAGQTHPEIRRRDGEAYRLSLLERCIAAGVVERVAFVDGYLSVPEISAILARTDVFCTPYRGMDQVVSGALTFALAAGCAVVSTPYRYAMDMLSDGAGALVPTDDPRAMAAAIARFIDEPLVLAGAERAAAPFRTRLSWPAVGVSLLDVINRVRTPVAAFVRPAATSSPSCRHEKSA